MSDRKTPYKFANRIGPDVATLVAKYPQDCAVRYRGHWFRFIRCCWAECPHHRKGFWRRYRNNDPAGTRSRNSKQTYCSEACALQAGRVLRAARQARWQANNRDDYLAMKRRWHAKQAAKERRGSGLGKRAVLSTTAIVNRPHQRKRVA